MKKILLCLFVLALSAANCHAKDKFEFRGVTWGMSREKVKAVETGRLLTPEIMYMEALEEFGEAAENEDFSYLFSEWALFYDANEPDWDMRRSTIYYGFTKPGEIGVFDVPADRLRSCSFTLLYKPDEIVTAWDDFKKRLALLTVKYGEPDVQVINENGIISYSYKYEHEFSEDLRARLKQIAEARIANDWSGLVSWHKVQNDFDINLDISHDEEDVFVSEYVHLSLNGETMAKWKNENAASAQ